MYRSSVGPYDAFGALYARAVAGYRRLGNRPRLRDTAGMAGIADHLFGRPEPGRPPHARAARRRRAARGHARRRLGAPLARDRRPAPRPPRRDPRPPSRRRRAPRPPGRRRRSRSTSTRSARSPSGAAAATPRPAMPRRPPGRSSAASAADRRSHIVLDGYCRPCRARPRRLGRSPLADRPGPGTVVDVRRAAQPPGVRPGLPDRRALSNT